MEIGGNQSIRKYMSVKFFLNERYELIWLLTFFTMCITLSKITRKEV